MFIRTRCICMYSSHVAKNGTNFRDLLSLCPFTSCILIFTSTVELPWQLPLNIVPYGCIGLYISHSREPITKFSRYHRDCDTRLFTIFSPVWPLTFRHDECVLNITSFICFICIIFATFRSEFFLSTSWPLKINLWGHRSSGRTILPTWRFIRLIVEEIVKHFFFTFWRLFFDHANFDHFIKCFFLCIVFFSLYRLLYAYAFCLFLFYICITFSSG